jgi:ProP effector
MICENGAAPATAAAVSEGQIGERLEGLIHTKSHPNIARKLIRSVAGRFSVFTEEPWRPHRPLAIGIDKALIATDILKPWEVRLVLRANTRRRMYQVALAAGGPRYDLDGNVAGEVTVEQAHSAKLLVEQMDAKTAASAAEVRAAHKAAREAEKARDRASGPVADKPEGPRPHSEAQPEKASAGAPHPVESMSPKRLGLADLKRAFQERKAAQAATKAAALRTPFATAIRITTRCCASAAPKGCSGLINMSGSGKASTASSPVSCGVWGHQRMKGDYRDE